VPELCPVHRSFIAMSGRNPVIETRPRNYSKRSFNAEAILVFMSLMTIVFPSDMHKETPLWDLLGGFFFFCIALYGALNGRVWTRFNWLYRSKEPKTF
jgi:hypothetical protein